MQSLFLIGGAVVLVAFTVLCVYAPWPLTVFRREKTSMNTEVWPQGWPHEAPDKPLSPEQAHQILHSPEHYDCRTDTCARKAAAFDVIDKASRAARE
jgi:hypothetical protein